MSDPNNNDDNPDPYIPSDEDEEEYATDEERIYFEFREYLNETLHHYNLVDTSHFVSNCNNCASKGTCEGREPVNLTYVRHPHVMEPWPLIAGHPMIGEDFRVGETDVIHGGDRHCQNWRLPAERWEVLRFFSESLEKMKIDHLEVAASRGRDPQSENLYTVLENIETMAEAIDVMSSPRSPNGVQWIPRFKNAQQKICAQAMVEDLVHLGAFVIDPSSLRTFYYNEKELLVLPFNEKDSRSLHGDFVNFLQNRFGLFKGISDICNWIAAFASQRYIERPVRQITYMKKLPQPTLYIHDRNKWVFRLTGEGEPTPIPNGKEELFYAEKEIRRSRPIKYIPIAERSEENPLIRGLCTDETDNPILNCFVNRTNYMAGSFLTKKEQFLQAAFLFYALPFRSILTQRPLTRWVGNAGSGKTFTPTMWFNFLLSPDYAPHDTGVPKKDDFLIMLANNPYLVMDNIDHDIKYMENSLAAVATGAKLTRRQLYTTWTQSTVKPEGFVFLTSRNPTFQRDDLADRSLIFHTKRVADNIAPDEMMQPLITHYDELWSVYMDQLNSIVHQMRINGHTHPPTTKHRMAGFAILSQTINETLGLCEAYGLELDTAMDNIDLERAAYTFSGDPLLPIFRLIAEELPNQKLTAAEILEKIKEIDEEADFTATGIGKLLKAREEPLNKLFGFNISYNRRTKRKLYQFGRDPSITADAPTTALDLFLDDDDDDSEPTEDVPEGYKELPMIEGFLQWFRDKADASSESVPFIVARLWLVNTYNLSSVDAEGVISQLLEGGQLFEPRPTELRLIGE